MKRQLGWISLFTAGALCLAPAPTAQAVAIATSQGLGADAEVRDHQPTFNFGAGTELATRVLDNAFAGEAGDGSDRFSAMYMRWDITGQALPSNGTAVRLTYRNTNLTPNRLTDTTPPGNNTAFRTGIAFYGLDRDHPGNAWVEGNKTGALATGNEITYLNAPGMGSTDVPATNLPGGDFNNGTKDFDFRDPDGAGPLRAPLTPLGVALFPALNGANRLPVGGALLFQSTNLNSFIASSINAGKPTVTIVAAIVHDGKVPVNDWKNFNYLFNPKEMLTLTVDTGYDPDGSGPLPPGNPNSGASNAAGPNGFSPFSPQLLLIPEPSSVALLGLASALATVRRRRS